MPKYMKKPVVVDAVQWFRPGDERHDAEATPWVRITESTSYAIGVVAAFSDADGKPLNFCLRVVDQWVYLPNGCWIVTSPDGDVQLVDEKRFAATYEAVADA